MIPLTKIENQIREISWVDCGRMGRQNEELWVLYWICWIYFACRRTMWKYLQTNEGDSLKLGREIWVEVNHSAEFLKLCHSLQGIFNPSPVPIGHYDLAHVFWLYLLFLSLFHFLPIWFSHNHSAFLIQFLFKPPNVTVKMETHCQLPWTYWCGFNCNRH